MKKDKGTEHRSPEVQEIIGEVPHWLIRWGMTAVFTVVIILIFLSWFIRYPETINIPVTIREASDSEVKIINGYHIDNKFFAEGFLSESNFLNVVNGQIVYIKLTAYPFQEYGALKGIVVRKSEVQENGKYRLIVGLTKGLATNYNKNINYYQHMTGIAEIFLEDSRLIEKIFDSFVIRIKK